MSQIGVITEQGDLGLGFNPISQKDQKTLLESSKKESKKEKEKGQR